MLLPWATLAAEQRQIPRVAFATAVLKRIAATDAPQIDHFNDYGKPSSHPKLSPVEIPLERASVSPRDLSPDILTLASFLWHSRALSHSA